MNWTGGSLQRTKNANKGVIQKQKAHFARARTQLQQSPGAPTAPFQPDYLHDDDRRLGQHLPSFGSGSVRHTGHSARKRGEIGERGITPTACRSRRGYNPRQAVNNSPHFAQGERKGEVESRKNREGRRIDTDADIEMQLLEANKRRLLGQRDWIGAVPAKPVDLQSMSIKEKSRIGKRRKLDGMRKAVARRRNSTTFPYRTGQDELEGHGDAYMGGALPKLTAADNIRVRIGSDAFTTAASTQLNNDTQSQTDSDSMLFDEEGESAEQRWESEAPQGATSSGHVPAANSASIGIQPSKSYEDYLPQHSQYTQRGLTARPDANARARIRHDPHVMMSQNQSIAERDATGPSYHITHHVEGAERPLKLVFGRRSPPKAASVASPNDQMGEVQHIHADLVAEEPETGRASRNVDEVHQSSVKRLSNSPAIVDDEPWRPYLDIGQSSFGHLYEDGGTGTSAPQPHVPARNTRADRTSWPQHTTEGKLTHVNLSTIFAPLPAPKRSSGRLPDARPLLRTDAAKGTNEHEAVWRSFVLGSDPESAIDTIHTHNETSEDSMSRATKGYASTRLLLSNAVTSVSSTPFETTPFRSLSGQASRISDGVQYAPHSGSRSIASAAPSYSVWGRIESADEDIQGEGQGEETPARSRFGAQSTHASMQNHASHDSEIFSDTRTARSDLDWRDRGRDDVSRRAQASGSVVWQRGQGSSIWDIPDSDEAGIDLVDPERL